MLHIVFDFLFLLGLVCSLSPSFMAWCISWCVTRMVNHASLSALKVPYVKFGIRTKGSVADTVL